MLGQWSYLLFAIGVLNIILGLLVALRDWRNKAHAAFAALSVAIGIWVGGIALFGLVGVAYELAAAKIFYLAPLFVGLFFVYFTWLFPKAKRLPPLAAILPAIPVVILSTFLIVSPQFITEKVVRLSWGSAVYVNQEQYLVYAVVIMSLFGYSLFTLWHRQREVMGLQKVQVQLFLVMGIVVSGICIWFNIALPHWLGDYRYIWVGPLATALYLISNAVSIIKHKMFDIRTAAIRSLAYALAITALSGVYFSLAYIASTTLFEGVSTTGVSMSLVNIALALVLAFLFQPIKKFFDHLTNKIFYRYGYDADSFIARIGRILTGTTHLHEVLELSLNETTKTLSASGGIFIVYRDHHEDVLVGGDEYGNFNEAEYSLLHRLADICGPGLMVVDKTLRHTDPDVAHIHRLLSKRHVALVLPLLSTHETIGYLLLGEQMSTSYTAKDRRVLETIANELVIAIMNARSVQVVRDLNTHLEERVNHATRQLLRSNKRLVDLDETKDEFLSMASHQLRTPLTSVKGYISMVLEGDVGDVTPAQRQLLEEAYTSSERMVHLIGDFLNVSRLQTGKFIIDPKLVNLAKITRQEVDSIQQIASTHDIAIRYTAPARFPELYIDEGKIRQVIMNFIDNAIYYSPEGKEVKVTLAIEDGSAVLRVIDKGMGVPASGQKKLFTKFYRAANARKQRPDGTGIGLYLAKKVIDGHRGSLVFESTEGKGSTFGFRLPIKRLSTPPPIEIVEE